MDDALDDYILNNSQPEPEILRELSRETWTTQMNPRMISGPVQGEFLAFVSRLCQPKIVLEIGTFTGYSAIRLCEGLQPGGILHTIDIDDEVQEVALRYFKKAGLDHQIHLHTGDACELIPSFDFKPDLVFIDGDKRQYLAYYEAVIDKINPGGILLADNVLWGGKVIDPLQQMDPATRGIREFNERIKKDPRVCNFILPLRDGINIIRKL
jgi:caffeoyl-CoA O-methyltransferase